MGTANISILIDNSIHEVEVKPHTTVSSLIQYIRHKFDISIFESLELRQQGKTLSPNSIVFMASFTNGKIVLECVRRKFLGL